jgi:hypothetical protein
VRVGLGRDHENEVTFLLHFNFPLQRADNLYDPRCCTSGIGGLQRHILYRSRNRGSCRNLFAKYPGADVSFPERLALLCGLGRSDGIRSRLPQGAGGGIFLLRHLSLLLGLSLHGGLLSSFLPCGPIEPIGSPCRRRRDRLTPRGRFSRTRRLRCLRELRSRPIEIHGAKADKQQGDRLDRELDVDGEEEPRGYLSPPPPPSRTDAGLDGGRETRRHLDVVQPSQEGDRPLEQYQLPLASHALPDVVFNHAPLRRLEFILEIGRKLASNVLAPHHNSR